MCDGKGVDDNPFDFETVKNIFEALKDYKKQNHF